MKVLIVTAMYPTPENPAFGSFIRTQVESLKQAGVQIDLLVLDGPFRKLIYPKGIIQIRHRLAHNPVDLVHAHYSYTGIVARTQWQVPVVVTYHGDDILGTRDAHGNITPFSRFVAAVGRILGELVDGVIVQTRQMASRFRRKDVHIIPHEVDTALFRPLERDHARTLLQLDPRKKYLLFAASPRIPVKRFPFAKAVANYLSQHDPTIELLVVYKESQERLALYMNACDALVFPSFQEGSPNIVKQAIACNLPVVATDVGDVRELIGNTEDCYVCNPDVMEFAEKLADILRHQRRTEGRARICHLEPQNVARQIIHVYEGILKKPNARLATQTQRLL